MSAVMVKHVDASSQTRHQSAVVKVKHSRQNLRYKVKHSKTPPARHLINHSKCSNYNRTAHRKPNTTLEYLFQTNILSAVLRRVYQHGELTGRFLIAGGRHLDLRLLALCPLLTAPSATLRVPRRLITLLTPLLLHLLLDHLRQVKARWASLTSQRGERTSQYTDHQTNIALRLC